MPASLMRASVSAFSLAFRSWRRRAWLSSLAVDVGEGVEDAVAEFFREIAVGL
jgi:hypothetical protein